MSTANDRLKTAEHISDRHAIGIALFVIGCLCVVLGIVGCLVWTPLGIVPPIGFLLLWIASRVVS